MVVIRGRETQQINPSGGRLFIQLVSEEEVRLSYCTGFHPAILAETHVALVKTTATKFACVRDLVSSSRGKRKRAIPGSVEDVAGQS